MIRYLPFSFAITILLACNKTTEKPQEMMSNTEPSKDTISMQSGYEEVNGLNMYYEIYGQGNPLVLLHGGGSTIYTSFGKIIPYLAKERKVIGVELQAHGHTADRDTPSSFEQDADDVAALLGKLNISKADFMGFSNGGNTAMQIAVRHPEIVNKLIIGSSFYRRDGMQPGFWDGMMKATFEEMPQIFKDEYLKIKNDTAGLRRMFTRDAVRMQTFKDWSDDILKSIKAPSLIIGGDHDVMTLEHAITMARLIPNCQMAIIPGGHGKYIGEITTLENGGWTQSYVVPMIESFLDEPLR